MNKTILILGGSGMAGHRLFLWLSRSTTHTVYATVRSRAALDSFLGPTDRARILDGVTAESLESVQRAIAQTSPDVVINCIGIIKQSPAAQDPIVSLQVNSLFSHRLALICRLAGARLIHLSTDCVFTGEKGCYSEADIADAQDLYGRTKLLGELAEPNTVTLRTSIIGHELSGASSLLEWFLAQQGEVKGYTGAIFSGVPTVELARIIAEYVLPHPELHGVVHVAAEPISKYDLLRLIAIRYGKSVHITPVDHPTIDRSLDGSRFQGLTGYVAPDWPTLIDQMYRDAILGPSVSPSLQAKS